MKYDARACQLNMDTGADRIRSDKGGRFYMSEKSKGVQRRIRPIFIVQDALHDSPVG